MKVQQLSEHLTGLVAAGLGEVEVVMQINLAYERVGTPEYTKTIYRGQNPHEIPEPFFVLTKEPTP